jgi:cytochrome bd-type quinol oxidase subunit 2
MRWSWLYNPAVTLIGLIASAVTIGQSIAVLGRLVCRMTHAEGDEYRRPRIVAATVSLFVAVAFAAVTWQAIVVEASKWGMGGAMGWVYPFSISGLAMGGAAVLLDDVRSRRQFSWQPCYLLVAGLAITAVVYFYRDDGPSGWVGWVAAAAPGLVYLSGGVPLFYARLGVHAAKPRQLEA